MNANVADPRELERAMHALGRISETLVSSYQALETRAQRVEAELERKVAELDALRGHLEAILEALPTGVVVRDALGNVLRVNRAALEILGVDASEVVGTRGGRALESVAADGRSTEIACGDGRTRTIASKSSPIQRGRPDQRGESVQILDDRTELVALSERLHRQHKLAALGNMAGGIAHELRNPMNAIRGFAALLEPRLPLESKERRWASLIVQGIGEADQILGSMLTLARTESMTRESVDARELVEAAIAAARVEGGGEGKWRIESSIEPADFPRFVADRIKLRQALRNLIANAIDAQPRGGALRVLATLARGEISLRVCDAGPGIPRELRSRVLEPFFTTRAEGTGLGLALVHTIAALHGGRVEVSPDPSPLGGADIAVHLPFVSPTPEKQDVDS